jgi:hypothetical protein
LFKNSKDSFNCFTVGISDICFLQAGFILLNINPELPRAIPNSTVSFKSAMLSFVATKTVTIRLLKD